MTQIPFLVDVDSTPLAAPDDSIRLLAARWAALLDEQPKLRIRNAAALLEVSEAALLCTRIGRGVQRITGPFPRLVEALGGLGEVMALTRNESAVLEKDGAYTGVEVGDVMGVVVGPDIDLRLFFRHWQHGFAVEEATKEGQAPRRSLQFFDADGVAIHKVYATDTTDMRAWDTLITRFLADDQSPGFVERPVDPPPATVSDAEVDVDAFQRDWLALTDTHHFFGLLRKHRVGRQQALRLAPAGMAERMTVETPRRLLESAAQSGLPIMIFVGSPGCIEIHTGPVRRVVVMGPWLNILDPGTQLHLREDRVAEVWLVRKPTDDGIVTSIELFDAEGCAIAYFFGERKPGKPELEGWRVLTQELLTQG